MDIGRGSRRARHVAANVAAAAAAAEAESEEVDSEPAEETRQERGRHLEPLAAAAAQTHVHANAHAHAHAHALTTPGATVINSTQTPSLQYDLNSSLERPGAPPVRRLQPQGTPNYSHRTPEQVYTRGASPPGVGGPPPNPFRLHRTAQYAGTRLSMPYDSDESGSEPDLSILAMARGRHPMGDQMRTVNTMTYDDEVLSQQQYEAEDTSIEEQVDEEEEEEEEEDEEEEQEEVVNLVDPAAIGLKEISNLGRFTVSSHKPGNGVEELRSDDLKLFWQSDGPQPHKLTVYFVKRVGIRDIRFFVDYNEDESYTPTKIVFKSGTSENNLIEFATMTMDSPVGWQQVPIAGAGGEPDGNTLVSYVLQMQILENHQNGKDTHLRGIKIYAFDADAAQGKGNGGVDEGVVKGGFDTGDRLGDIVRDLAAARLEGGEVGFTVPDFMREPEIR